MFLVSKKYNCYFFKKFFKNICCHIVPSVLSCSIYKFFFFAKTNFYCLKKYNVLFPLINKLFFSASSRFIQFDFVLITILRILLVLSYSISLF